MTVALLLLNFTGVSLIFTQAQSTDKETRQAAWKKKLEEARRQVVQAPTLPCAPQQVHSLKVVSLDVQICSLGKVLSAVFGADIQAVVFCFLSLGCLVCISNWESRCRACCDLQMAASKKVEFFTEKIPTPRFDADLAYFARCLGLRATPRFEQARLGGASKMRHCHCILNFFEG